MDLNKDSYLLDEQSTFEEEDLTEEYKSKYSQDLFDNISRRKYKKLTKEEEKQFFEKINSGDEKAKEEFAEINQGLVYSIAYSFFKHYPNMSIDDFLQEGNIGLLIAIDKFDANLGYKFSTYSTRRIRTYIHEFIKKNRSLIKLPNYQKKVLLPLRNKITNLVSNTNKQLTKSEIAEELGEDISLIEEALNFSIFDDSLDEFIYSDDSKTTLLDTIPSEDCSPEYFANIDTEKSNIKNIFENYLNENEAKVLEKRLPIFNNGETLTFQNVGDQLGISKQRVDQLEKVAIRKLKKYFEKIL